MSADATLTRPAPLPLDYSGGEIVSRWTLPPLFIGCFTVVSLVSPLFAVAMFMQVVSDEPFMVWRVSDFTFYIGAPLLYGVLWAFVTGRLFVAYRPPRLHPLWALAVIWVLINYGLLSVAPVGYLQDMWRQGENVSDGP